MGHLVVDGAARQESADELRCLTGRVQVEDAAIFVRARAHLETIVDAAP